MANGRYRRDDDAVRPDPGPFAGPGRSLGAGYSDYGFGRENTRRDWEEPARDEGGNAYGGREGHGHGPGRDRERDDRPDRTRSGHGMGGGDAGRDPQGYGGGQRGGYGYYGEDRGGRDFGQESGYGGGDDRGRGYPSGDEHRGPARPAGIGYGREYGTFAYDRDYQPYAGTRGSAASRQEQEGPHRGRGPRGYRRSDERIREDVSDRLTEDPSLDASDIEVNVSDGEVTLTGTVRRREDKRQAEDLADSVSGVSHVQNNLRVGTEQGPASGPTAGRTSGTSFNVGS
ncbi:BON domain-containing protein [Geminicoccus harenae]|uniref:BON domain-containing protein n=2 Tax=Geminicoccus harenae TaxID=2498453 RepID=UPI001C944C4D|nr:BON domain-containing protein [Geminicoccus harenae]